MISSYEGRAFCDISPFTAKAQTQPSLPQGFT